ncbi:MAG: Sec-independent protein translocase protein TatB [Pseudomonadota bacterium]
MFDLGWTELLVVGIVALIILGDDFPSMFRTLGRFTGKMRKMAREFSRAMEEAADESGVKDISKTLKSAASPKSMGISGLEKAAKGFESWETSKSAADPSNGKDSTASASESTDGGPNDASAAAEADAQPEAETEPQKAPDPGP